MQGLMPLAMPITARREPMAAVGLPHEATCTPSQCHRPTKLATSAGPWVRSSPCSRGSTRGLHTRKVMIPPRLVGVGEVGQQCSLGEQMACACIRVLRAEWQLLTASCALHAASCCVRDTGSLHLPVPTGIRATLDGCRRMSHCTHNLTKPCAPAVGVTRRTTSQLH